MSMSTAIAALKKQAASLVADAIVVEAGARDLEVRADAERQRAARYRQEAAALEDGAATLEKIEQGLAILADAAAPIAVGVSGSGDAKQAAEEGPL